MYIYVYVEGITEPMETSGSTQDSFVRVAQLGNNFEEQEEAT
jgi:hypothetical protein